MPSGTLDNSERCGKRARDGSEDEGFDSSYDSDDGGDGLEEGLQAGSVAGSSVGKNSMDRGGFCPGDPLYHWGSRASECPRGGSAGEYERVVAGGGAFISQETSLGKNVEGTRELLVPPMGPGERLIVTAGGQAQSMGARLLASAKTINARYGGNDVGGCCFWKRADGSLRPTYVMVGLEDRLEGKIFSDNMVLETLKRPGVKAGRAAVYGLMTSLGFKGYAPVKEDRCGNEDPAAMSDLFAAAKLCVVGERIRWKLMLSNVPLHRVALVYAILRFAWSHRSSSVYSFVDEMRCLMAAHLPAVGRLDEGKLLDAAKWAQQLFWINIDFTIDRPGTLNADALKVAPMIRSAGLEVDPRTDGGLNCVYFKKDKDEGVARGLKVYNKPAETMQQGKSVRSRDPADKCGYLLNPSTRGLAAVFRNASYYSNGVTRLEVTLGGGNSDEEFPARFEALMDLMLKVIPLLWEPGVLVSCSFHDHIAHMETYVGRTTCVYYPSVAEEKALRWREEYKAADNFARKRLRKQLNKVPDGFVCRWWNSLTGKVNGYVIHSNFAVQGHSPKAGWDVWVRVVAWASSCGSQPSLFIGAAIRSDLCGVYYRKLDVTRTGPSLWMILCWDCGFKIGNFKNHVTDWGRVGVQPDLLNNLRMQLVDPSVKPSFGTMGGMDISVSVSPSSEDSWFVSDIEKMAVVTGVSRRVYEVKDHNESLGTWTACRRHKVLGDSKLEFEVGGDRFYAPSGGASKKLIKHLEDFPGSTFEVVVDPGRNFRWRVSGVASGSKALVKCRAARELPVEALSYGILGAGLESVGRKSSLYVSVVSGGTFFLPQSIREQVFAELNLKETDPFCDEAVDSFLKTKLVLHAARRSGRVRGQTNGEEFLSIVDSSGAVVMTNVDDGWKRQRV